SAADLDEQVVPTRIPTAVIWEVFTGIGNAPFKGHGNELRALYEKLIASRSTVALTPKVAVARAN
ncbi:hypothetical protein HKX41_12090, partial [Salinisphaera sp. USBA-960]|nr:hypothetical protein [Salifodinibacter halophilus]